MRALIATVAITVLLNARPASAYRPFDTTDADVADTGELEVELGPVGYLRRARQRSLVVPAVILNVGVLRGWEVVLEGRELISLEGEGMPGRPRAQLVDTGLSLKGVLRRGALQGGTGPSVATELGALLPTWNGEPGVGASGTVIVSQRWRPATVHVNGIVVYSRAHDVDLLGSLIVEGPYTWRVRPVAEVLVDREVNASAGYATLAGAIWRLNDQLALDAAGRMAHGDGGNVIEVRAGLTWATALWAP